MYIYIYTCVYIYIYTYIYIYIYNSYTNILTTHADILASGQRRRGRPSLRDKLNGIL